MRRAWLPRVPGRLTTRLTLGLVALVIVAGVVTSLAVYGLIGRSLRAELVRSAETLTSATATNLVGPLLAGDEVAVRAALTTLIREQEDVAYAYGHGPDGQVVHTFDAGFPADLLAISAPSSRLERTLLRMDRTPIHHVAVAPIPTLPLEVHVGVSEARILTAQRSAAFFLALLTLVGCAAAGSLATAFTRFTVRPLRQLTEHVRRLGPGRLDVRLPGTGTEETDQLAGALNAMSEQLETAARHRELTEEGYRELLRAGSAVGEAVALIADDGPSEGSFVYVNERFAAVAGWDPAELVGRNAATVLSAASLDSARGSWDRLRSDGAQVETTEITLIDRANTARSLETASAVIDYQGRRVLAWFARDVTERHEREQEVRRQNRELAALHAVASVMAEPLVPDQFLTRALDVTLSALGSGAGCVVITDDGWPRLAAKRGPVCDLPPEANLSDCPCGHAAVDGQTTLSSDGPLPCQRGARGTAVRAAPPCSVVPLRAGRSTLGALRMTPRSDQAADASELRLLTAIGQQVAIGLHRARLWEDLREQEQIRRELYLRAIRAQEDERQRIARELHDSTGQSLNALVLGLNTTSLALQAGSEDVGRMVDRLRSAASDTVHELQSIIYDLRPSLLDDLGLVPAVRWFVEDRLRPSGVTPVLVVDGTPMRLPTEVETALFRMTQEAVTNIARHAAAEHAEVRMVFDRRYAVLTITDDGVGFSAEPVGRGAGDGRHLGLLGMQERATLLGGEVIVNSSPGMGTRIVIYVPTEPRS